MKNKVILLVLVLFSLIPLAFAFNEKYFYEEKNASVSDFIVQHKRNPPVHQYIAYQSYFLLPDNIQSEFSQYIGSDEECVSTSCGSEDEGDEITEGAYEEDKFGRWLNHFWDPDQGLDAGLWNEQSAYRIAQNYWDNEVIPNYPSDKAKSYYYLGRVTHLLEDMSVPAHVHRDPHWGPYGDDSYEEYMPDHYQEYTASGSPTIKSNLYGLFYDMAEISDDFDSDDYSGEIDEGNRQIDCFLGFCDISDANSQIIGNTLMPEAMKHVAGLYKLFWIETSDQNCPDSCCDSYDHFKLNNEQPSGFSDYYFVSGANSPTGTSYIKHRNYYCTGSSASETYSDSTIDTCGTCKFGNEGSSSCSNYGTSTLYSSTTACSPGIGDNNYGIGGEYACQSYCDGNGNADYAGSCVYDSICDTDDDDDGYNSIDSGGNDCNDQNPNVNPGSNEVCDGLDNNCDGFIDEEEICAPLEIELENPIGEWEDEDFLLINVSLNKLAQWINVTVYSEPHNEICYNCSELSFIAESLEEGEHIIIVEALDFENNLTSLQSNFSVDTTQPQISITKEASWVSPNSPVEISMNVTDENFKNGRITISDITEDSMPELVYNLSLADKLQTVIWNAKKHELVVDGEDIPITVSLNEEIYELSGSLCSFSSGDPDSPSPPGNVNASIDDDAMMGDENSPVTIIEFSDYQCPFCKRFWNETLPQIKSQYIDAGKVRLIYRDFPLTSIHPMAQKSAEAAECVRDLGGDVAYFNMHDKMFENQQSLSIGNLKTWAQELGYNIDNCLDTGEFQSEVENDSLDAQAAGGRGTPYFVINGIPLSGAQPFSAFEQVIEQALNSSGGSSGGGGGCGGPFIARFNATTLEFMNFSIIPDNPEDSTFSFQSLNGTRISIPLNSTFELSEEVVENNKTFEVEVTVFDKAGNSNSAITTLLSDTLPPTITNSNPLNGTQVNKLETLMINLTDLHGIDEENVEITATLNGLSFTDFNVSYFVEEIINLPTISFSCSPNPVVQGEIITCNCTATDEIDPNPIVNYTVNPPTSEIGTFMTSCTATNEAGKSATLSLSYAVISPDNEGSFPGGGGSGGGGGGSIRQTSTAIITLLNPQNGNYVFTIKAKDNLNNAEDYQIFIEDINLFEDINTNIENLTFEENNITNASDSTKAIDFRENNSSIVSFNWDYNISNLDFSLISIKKQNENATEGSLIIYGIDLTSQNQTKTVLVDKISGNADKVCIKDEEIVSISEVSSNCDGSNEVSLSCPGSSEGYSCNLTMNNTKYEITGLNHSAIKEFKFTPLASSNPPNNNGGGGGGGGGGSFRTTTINQTNETSNQTTEIIPLVSNGTGTFGEENQTQGNGASPITGATIGTTIKRWSLPVLIFIALVVGGMIGVRAHKKRKRKSKTMAPPITQRKKNEINIAQQTCPSCGRNNASWRRFCVHCGKSLRFY